MKRFRRTLAGAIALVSSVVIGMTTLTGCGAKESVVRDEKTINIRACIGGYGDSWLRALADKFNEVYADKGYKANVLASSTDLESKVAMKELYSKDDWVDLYFVNVNNTMAQFTESGGEYGQLVADLTDTDNDDFHFCVSPKFSSASAVCCLRSTIKTLLNSAPMISMTEARYSHKSNTITAPSVP